MSAGLPNSCFEMAFTAGPEHIDMLGHVNNTVWLAWTQDIAIAHWDAIATPDMQARWLWVVTRHEIDYRGNVGEGATVQAHTFVGEPPRGARFDRHVEFHDDAGRLLVKGKSTWAILDKHTRRIQRVPADVTALFLG